MTEKQVQKYDYQNTMPAVLIEKAISGSADLDKLEKLLALQERWERNEAKKAYVSAMTNFKANPPKINKDKRVDFTSQKGRTSYDHASLANVCDKISSALSEHGLSVAWSTQQYNGDPNIYVTCTITHECGHSESTTLNAAPDNTGNKNPIQAVGSTISYLERYTVLALTGLATHDMDNDGMHLEDIEKISEKHLADLRALIEEVGADEVKFIKFLKLKSLEDMPDSLYDKAVKELERKRNK
jgi:hypothetical protein